ncbi:MAG: apolipoprotein N-acyltransferase [Phenylobacterium sp.]
MPVRTAPSRMSEPAAPRYPALAGADPLVRYRGVLALGAGAVAATGFEPLGLWPVTLAAVALLMALVARAPGPARAALIGWLFGIGHFTVGNTWIATAFTYQADMPAWLGWIAVVALALYLAVFPALATLAAWFFRERVVAGDGARAGAAAWPFVLAFAGCWTIAEWLRSWVCTGFAWNPLGMVTLAGFARPGLAMLAPWTGTYALSALVVLLAGCWLMATRRLSPGARAGLAIAPVAALMVPQALAPPLPPGTLAFTLVQPNVPQAELTDPAKYEGQFRRIAGLTLARRPGERRLVLWPESGIPDYLRDGYPQVFYEDSTFAADPALARARIGRVIGPGAMLLTGAVDLELARGRVVAARNAVTAVDAGGGLRGSYAKAHLVPYGEYLPLRSLLEPLGLSRLVAGTLDFWPGPGPQTLDLGPWGRVGVQICYEIIFSGQVVDRADRPAFLFNPSNDGWFGAWGPPQHLAQARMRAIEEGLPVLRATTTGISAVIDADGVVRAHLPQHVSGRLDGTVPPPHPPTLFARAGNLLPLGWAGLLLVLSAIALHRRRR